MNRLGHCTTEDAGLEDTYQEHYGAYRQAQLEAETLYGGTAIEPGFEFMRFDPIDCSAKATARYIRDTEVGTREAATILTTQIARMPGLWLGTMRVCRAMVEDATVGPSEYQPDERPVLMLKFIPAARAQLAQLTAARVNEALAVRIDGRLVSEPRIYEPITGGEIVLSGGEDNLPHDIRSAALRPC